jgi:cell division cycle 2-like protein
MQDGSVQLASVSPYRTLELFLNSSIYDEWIDMWGHGCIMAELLAGTGVSFFDCGSDAQGLKGLLQVVGDKGFMEWSGL